MNVKVDIRFTWLVYNFSSRSLKTNYINKSCKFSNEVCTYNPVFIKQNCIKETTLSRITTDDRILLQQPGADTDAS
jgi:hypothetical protein